MSLIKKHPPLLIQRIYTFAMGFLAFTVTAQEGGGGISKKVYTATRLQAGQAPVIDGALTEDLWEQGEWSGDFVQWEPAENSPPSQNTSFKILYDEQFLYVAVRSHDKAPDKIERRLARRDAFAGDKVAIVIDSYHDRRTAFAFTTTAAGVKGDEFVSNNGEIWDRSWSPIWYTAAGMDDEGWVLECKIPFSQFKFGNAKEQVWGLQVIRHLFREDERSVWQRIPRDAPGWVSEFGLLRGLIDIKPQKQLEIQPFFVNRFDAYQEEAGNPFKDGSDYQLNGGLDAKIGITNDLTLDLTVNPDFGQVDADPGAIALDGFQIFFDERRPFFVENKNIFNYRFANGNDNVFYSRRIGRDPQGTVDLLDGEYADLPTNTTILGAAKFSGKTRNGWSLGLLESVTGNMFAEVVRDGNSSRELVEPMTNYLVGRAQKDFNDRNSYMGTIFTATNRNLEGELDFLRRAAYTGGLDFRHSWKNRNYYLEGNIVGSHVQGSEEAITATQQSLTHLFQRTDAGHVEVDSSRTSLTGTGGKLEFGKAGGGNWRYEAGATWRSPELELNDVGFLRKTDELTQYTGARYLFLRPTNWYRDGRLSFRQFTSYDFDGNYNRIRYDLKGFMNYQNNWWTNIGLGHKPLIYSNTVLRGGPRWRWSDENSAFLFFGSDNRKKFNFTMGHVNSQAREGNFAFKLYSLQLRYQPFDALNVSLATEFRDNQNKTQYVTEASWNGEPRYIVGTIDQKTFNTSLRFNYSLNPNLSIQYYGQPFISRGTYTDFKRVKDSQAERLNERVALYSDGQLDRSGTVYSVDENFDGTIDYSFEDPNFSFVQFQSNLVLRWEYIPGSEIFMVWSQGISGNGEPMESLGQNLDRQILGQQAENTFLIKATYRFIL